MHVKIEAKPVGPLSILDSIPGDRLAILEGLNGIGKTLTVRLLQICTGEMPYRTDSQAWSSLCVGLGEFKVTISQLSGDVREIQWQGDSRIWRTGPGLGMSAVEFESITLDATAGTIEDVRRVLVVNRIAGDEGLVDALAQLAEADAELVRSWTSKYAGPDSGPLASLEDTVETARVQIPLWTVSHYEDLLQATAGLRDRRVALVKKVSDLDEVRKKVAGAVDLLRRLNELHGRAPELEGRLRDLDQRIEQAQQQRHDLDRQIAALAGKVAMAKPAKRELTNATRTLDRNRANLVGAAQRAGRAASALGLAADDPNAANEYLERQKVRLDELIVAQSELDASPSMQGLLGAVAESLGGAEQRGLGSQIAIEDSERGLALTVSEVRAGFVMRRRTLESQPAPPEAREVADAIAATRQQLQMARNLVTFYDDLERFRRLVTANEDRVTSALVAADAAAESEMRVQDQARRTLDGQLLGMATERAALQEQLGTPSGASAQRSLAEQLKEALAACGETQESLPDATTGIEEDLTRLQVELENVVEELTASTKERSRVESESRRTAALLAGADFAWLDVKSTVPEDAEGAQATRLRIALNEQVRATVDAIMDRLGAQRAQLGAVTTALKDIGRHIRGEDPSLGEYSEPLQRWLGETFSVWFNRARVREQLLPAATGPVTVDVAKRIVLWPEGDVTRTRPLDAFSSGEQAFAYTRARIGVFDEELRRPTNRLIVLDEFGAFISHDLMRELQGYLRDRVAENPNDQVLVVLPLSRDYGELAATAVGEEGRRLEQLHEQISTRKYVVQVLA